MTVAGLGNQRRAPDSGPREGYLKPDATPAAFPARASSQAMADARTYLRNGEQLVLTMVLPVLILVGLAHSGQPDLGADGAQRLDLVVAGVFALAIISTSFTGQAIGTGFDRRYGVLRMLAATPLGRGGLLGGRVLAVLVVETVQLLVLGAVAVPLGWQPSASALVPGTFVVLLGTASFVALGLLLAGTVRAEAVLAAANLIWILLVAGGGVLVPPDQLGAWGAVVRWLPSGALGDLSRAALVDGTVAWFSCGVLVVWAVVGGLAVRRWFRWE